MCAGIKTTNQDLECNLGICMFLFWSSCLNRKILAVQWNVCSLKTPTKSFLTRLQQNLLYIKESQRLQYLHRWLINRVLTLEVLAVNGVPGWDIKNKTDKQCVHFRRMSVSSHWNSDFQTVSLFWTGLFCESFNQFTKSDWIRVDSCISSQNCPSISEPISQFVC